MKEAFQLPLTLEQRGLGALTPSAVKNSHITLQSAFCICSSALVDSTDRGSCSTAVHIF